VVTGQLSDIVFTDHRHEADIHRHGPTRRLPKITGIDRHEAAGGIFSVGFEDNTGGRIRYRAKRRSGYG